jgi:protein O-mannosyl-transferase
MSMGINTERVWGPGWLIGLVFAGAVLAVYAPACGGDFGFINYDDDYYVTDNAHVQKGLTAEGLRWAFTSLYDANSWHPLTWLSLQLDSQLFGTSAAGYHRTNVLLHAVNTVLLFWLLKRLTGAVWRSAAVAALFGLHPAHVEAVAWVTARKDVLSTLFWLLTTASYAWYAERPAVGRYLLMLLLFALGLMAKPMLVTLPAVLLLLDYWPISRWPADPTHTTRYRPASLRWLLVEKLPLVALVIPAILVTLWSQPQGATIPTNVAPFDRLANVLVSYLQYLRMAFWPVDLAILYPHPDAAPPVWQTVAAGLLLAGLTLGFLWAGRSRRYLAVGWLWFLGTLVPVIGLVQHIGMSGSGALADRYTYVPYIGLFIVPVWAIADICRRESPRIVAAAVLAGAALACCLVLTWRQLNTWRDSETLWRHALAVTEKNGGAHAMLGVALADKGRSGGAVEQFEESLRLDPGNPTTHVNLAVALVPLGRLDEAVTHLERSLQLRPHAAITDSDPASVGEVARRLPPVERRQVAMTHLNLGAIREQQGRRQEAIEHFATAIEFDPQFTEAGIGLADTLSRMGEFEQARQQLERLLEGEPPPPRLYLVHEDLGRLLRGQGKLAEAVECYNHALELQGDYAEAWNGKGVALEWLGRLDEATVCCQRAVELQPNQLQYHLNLGYLLYVSGQQASAMEQYRAAFVLQPNWPGIALAEAWALATHPDARRRDGKVALRTATLICQATDNQLAPALEARAAAYAELGQFDEAVTWQRQALALPPREGEPTLRTAATERLRLYERRQPYREPSAAGAP